MKLEVSKWFWDSFLGFLAKVIEVSFRVLLLLTPLWVFILLIQSREKVSSTSNISVYTSDKSVWQFIFPGFMLVAVNKNMIKEKVAEINAVLQKEVKNNVFTLLFFTFAIILTCAIIFIVRN